MSRHTPLPDTDPPSPVDKPVATAPLLRRILVVEDDRDTRALFSEVLQEAGYETIEAETGKRAVALALAQPFTAVFMDLEMPEMGGLEATRVLKQNGRTKEIPVIMVTGSSNQLQLLASRDAGCAALLAKPCPAGVLLSALEHVLRGEPIPLRYSSIGG